MNHKDNLYLVQRWMTLAYIACKLVNEVLPLLSMVFNYDVKRYHAATLHP